MAEPQHEAKIAEFERHYEREAARIKRLLDELCANKLIPVSVVATKTKTFVGELLYVCAIVAQRSDGVRCHTCSLAQV